MRSTASSGVITPSATSSRTIRSAACAVRLAGARLQHVERALLDRELDVLHLAVVLLEPLDRRDELVVGLGQQLAHARDRLGRADAGDDVLALRVLQELAVQHALAGRRVAREADAGARALAAVAEHHLADVGGGAEVVGDVVARAGRRARAARPRSGRPREIARRSCSRGSCGKSVPGALAVEPLELGAEPAQVVAREVGVELRRRARPCAASSASSKTCDADARDDVAEHLQEAAVGVVGEARRRPSPRPAPRRPRRSGRG